MPFVLHKFEQGFFLMLEVLWLPFCLIWIFWNELKQKLWNVLITQVINRVQRLSSLNSFGN